MWFFPSGRQCPVDDRRPDISSSLIRKLLNETPIHQALSAVNGLALYAEQLLCSLKLCNCMLEMSDASIPTSTVVVGGGSDIKQREELIVSSALETKHYKFRGMTTEVAVMTFMQNRKLDVVGKHNCITLRM